MHHVNLKPVLIFDIETTKTTNAAIIDRIKDKLKPPATLKKPESIQEWWTTQSGQALEDKLAQTALNGLQGDVTAIGWFIAVTDSGFDLDYAPTSVDPVIHIRKTDQSVQAFLSETYRAMEKDIGKHKGTRGSWDVRVAGHNINNFDLPFLRQQSMRYSVRHMQYFPHAYRGRREDCIDTMVELAGYKEFISLQDAAITFGIPWDNASIPGDQVPNAWDTQDYDAVAQHLTNDVRVTAELALRILSFNGSAQGVADD
jgi:hypothetical protein